MVHMCTIIPPEDSLIVLFVIMCLAFCVCVCLFAFHLVVFLDYAECSVVVLLVCLCFCGCVCGRITFFAF